MEHCIRCLVHESISEYKLGVERLKDRAGDFWVAAATTRINDRLGILSLLQDPFKELPQVCDWKLHSIACHTQFSGRLSLRFGQSSTLHLSQFLWPPWIWLLRLPSHLPSHCGVSSRRPTPLPINCWVFGVYTRLPRFTIESLTGLNISLRILQASDQASVSNLGMVLLVIHLPIWVCWPLCQKC